MTLCAVVVAAVLGVLFAGFCLWLAECTPHRDGEIPPPEEHTLDLTGRRFGDREWRS